MTTGPFTDGMPGPSRRDTLNQMWQTWQDALSSVAKGDSGWSPLIRSVQDGDRVVLEVYDWTGGQGVKPTQTGFLGSTGFVATADLAIDTRGPQGLQGEQGLLGEPGEDAIAPVWYQGVDDPDNGGGADGDLYLQVNGNVWKKFDGVWIFSGVNIKGGKGDTGTAATITVGNVTTGAPGTPASVTNTGTSESAVFNFTIPRGADGSGTGDMLKSEYDSIGDGVVNAARAVPWAGITEKPAVIAAGADQVSARLAINAAVSDHTHSATDVSFTPVGNLVATNVQAAIAELDSDLTTALGDVSAALIAING